jgi:hypothetical protein
MNEQSQITQTPYESLLEERSAFLQAGMTAKVAEWDFKLKSLETAEKYPRIDFNHIANEFGIEGLNQALDTKRQAQSAKILELDEKAKGYCKDLFKKSRLSETAVYSFIDSAGWQWENDPEMTARIIQVLAPKLASRVARTTLEMAFKIKEVELERIDYRTAFVKIQKIENYQQNDNPPMTELLKTVNANLSGIFHQLYIAYPMIDNVKQIDPIIFGTLQDPTKQYDELDESSFNGWMTDISMERLDSVNFGDMYEVAQWV